MSDRIKIVESEIRADQVAQAIAAVNTVIEKVTIDATKGGYEVHPEAYAPRMIVFVQSTGEHFELLRTGEAITWGSTPPPESLEYWAIDVPHISWIGVHRRG